MKYLFKNGTVVSGRGTRRADVLVDGEKIVQVARTINDPIARVVDVSGKLLMPGFIDAHTHFDLDVSIPPRRTTLKAARWRHCAAALPRWWILPARKRVKACIMGLPCGTRRPTGAAGATMGST